MRARRAAGIGVAALAALGCGCGQAPRAPRPVPAALPRVAEPAAPIGAPGPARYAAEPQQGWMEDLPDGGHRVVVHQRRAELRGLAFTPVGPPEPAVEAGARAPAWAAQARPAQPRAAYVFWRDREVFVTDRFDGALERVGTAPGDVEGTFAWLDGVGLSTAAGLFVVRAGARAGEELGPLGVPGAAFAVAADARRALVLTAFGRARYTADGGGSWRDLSAELTDAVDAEAQGEAIVVTLSGGRKRRVLSDGRVEDAPLAVMRRSPRRPAPGPELDVTWPEEAGSALRAAIEAGVPLPDGGAVVISGGVVGRVDLATGLASSAARLPPDSGECAPFRAPEGVLALCVGEERARVIEISSAPRAPRIEREFEIDPPDEGGYRNQRDRFVGVDGEALAFLGPCAGRPRPQLAIDAISSASALNPSPQQTPVICARSAPGEWTEIRLDPEDATDVIAWVPRPGGAATALVLRPGPLLGDEPRASARGPLRVVRMARGEPPLSLPQYPWGGAGGTGILSRALRVRADGAIEGWMPVQSGSLDREPVVITPEGRAEARALPPQANVLAAAGPLALAQSEDGRLYETVDFGRRWIEVPPPPGEPLARPGECSLIGCQVGSMMRLGWSGLDPTTRGAAPALDPAVAEAAARLLRERRTPRRPMPATPLVRLSCSAAGLPEGSRVPESYGFGVTATPVARHSGMTRVGAIGSMILPWSGGPQQLAASGDAELAWVAPLDPAGRIRRLAVPLSGGHLAGLSYRPYEAPLGFVIDGAGKVAPIAAGPSNGCLAGLLDQAGVTRPIGGCVANPSVGAALPDRILILSSSWRGHAVTSAAVPGGGRPLSQRELAVTPVAQQAWRRFSFGAGLRGGAPVFVAVDGSGGAVLAPVDPERGIFHVEEPLAPLGALRPGDAPGCARGAASRSDEARVVLPFDTEIGLAAGALPGVSASGTYGLAVIRWSAAAACLDAVEIAARDERFEGELGFYDPPGTVKKVVARFAGPDPAWSAPQRGEGARAPQGAGSAAGASAALVLITNGQEVRQPLSCRSVAP